MRETYQANVDTVDIGYWKPFVPILLTDDIVIARVNERGEWEPVPSLADSTGKCTVKRGVKRHRCIHGHDIRLVWL